MEKLGGRMRLIEVDKGGSRIDRYLADIYKDKSRSFIQKLIKREEIRVNEKTVKSNYRLEIGDIIQIGDMTEEKIELVPQNLNIKVIYEDKHIALVEKPVDMIVHPSKNNKDKTLVNGLIYKIDELSTAGEYYRPGIVHRLDKNTSGIMLVSKTNKAYYSLVNQFKNRTIVRGYLALVWGNPREKKGLINAPIGRDPNDRTKMCVIDKNSKEALTEYKLLEEYEGYSLIAYSLKTGRMHQIRVHSAYIGHPVIGDDRYSNIETREKYQLLHANKLGFIHPKTDEYMEFETKTPARFKKYLGDDK